MERGLEPGAQSVIAWSYAGNSAIQDQITANPLGYPPPTFPRDFSTNKGTTIYLPRDIITSTYRARNNVIIRNPNNHPTTDFTNLYDDPIKFIPQENARPDAPWPTRADRDGDTPPPGGRLNNLRPLPRWRTTIRQHPQSGGAPGWVAREELEEISNAVGGNFFWDEGMKKTLRGGGGRYEGWTQIRGIVGDTSDRVWNPYLPAGRLEDRIRNTEEWHWANQPYGRLLGAAVGPNQHRPDDAPGGTSWQGTKINSEAPRASADVNIAVGRSDYPIGSSVRNYLTAEEIVEVVGDKTSLQAAERAHHSDLINPPIAQSVARV